MCLAVEPQFDLLMRMLRTLDRSEQALTIVNTLLLEILDQHTTESAIVQQVNQIRKLLEISSEGGNPTLLVQDCKNVLISGI